MASNPLARSAQSRHFQCRLCQQSFTKNEHLARHVRSHKKQKPFECPDCGNRYGRQDILIRHRRDVRCKLSQASRSTDKPPLPQAARGVHVSSPVAPQPREGQSAAVVSSPLEGASQITSDVSQFNYNPTDFQDVAQAPANLNQSGFLGFNSAVSSLGPSPGGAAFPTGFPDLSACFPAWDVDIGLHDLLMDTDSLLPGPETAQERPAIAKADAGLTQVQHIHNIWFTRLPEHPAYTVYPAYNTEPELGQASAPMSPSAQGAEIDDRHRETVRKRLQILPHEPTIPSADVLNVCIRLYFTKVHPVFPVVHPASFRPSRDTSSLLVAMCAMGSLFTGSAQGLDQGIYLFQHSYKSTILRWEQLLLGSSDVMASVAQCAIVCQMFGLLSGNPLLLLTVDGFHGPPIAWARHVRLHKGRTPVLLEPTATDSQLEETWKAWARNEELLRIAHGLYILDAELGSLLHHEPVQNFEFYDFSLTSSDTAFFAPSAQEWKSIYLAEMHQRSQSPSPDSDVQPRSCFDLFRVPVTSAFTAYAFLEGLATEVLLKRPMQHTTEKRESHRASLAHFHSRFLKPRIQDKQDTLQLLILWHVAYMSTCIDFDLLERSNGRDGSSLTSEEQGALTAWTTSGEAQRCIAHALMIKKHMEEGKRVSELAMHVPRAMFWAGLALFACIRHCPKEKHHQELLSAETIRREFRSMGVDGILPSSEVNALAIFDASSLKMALFSVVDLLQHLGHWEIARKFAAILTALCNFQFGE